MCVFVYRCLIFFIFHLQSFYLFFLIGENINALNVEIEWTF